MSVNLPEEAIHDPKVACAWKDIVASWGRLLDRVTWVSRRASSSGTSSTTSSSTPRTTPYSRVALCGTDHRRLLRRCRAALVRLAGPDAVGDHRGWGPFIDLERGQCARKLGLFPQIDGQSVCLALEVDPGDTMSQARMLYEQVPLDDVVALLNEPNWVGWSNFHLMYMTSGFFRPAHLTAIPDYWQRWASRPDLIRRWTEDEFDAAFDALLQLGMVSSAHRGEFDGQTSQTKRDNICFAPGITLQWQLPLEEAAKLDDRDALEDAIRAAIEQATKALRLRWPAAGAVVGG